MRIVSGSQDASVRLWGAQTRLCECLGVQWLTCGHVFACGADASTLALVAEKPAAHSDRVYSVGFSPDGTRIVSGSQDMSIKLWGGHASSHMHAILTVLCSV
eukprot:5385382-Prymnesium_polylepis.3